MGLSMIVTLVAVGALALVALAAFLLRGPGPKRRVLALFRRPPRPSRPPGPDHYYRPYWS